MSEVPSGRPTTQEIRTIAKRTCHILQRNDLPCCLMGSAAAWLWGTTRTPNDIDVVVITEQFDPEYIKQLLVEEDDRFYLIPSRRRGAAYEVLWCRLPGFRTSRRACKVDILIPGILNIPWINDDELRYISNIPVMPLLCLLVLKTQGWWDNRTSFRQDLRNKESGDIADVMGLLTVASDRGVDIRDAPEYMRPDLLNIG
ncbi:hypothetical protein EW146_g3535 [Bondarzewia mesenterica]|uniref:Uncharacterized protein n=1 Tax=Bondarzewia mesenterica TaxID=1095465 RepID=A0A4S4LX86_9AGAM|nr:hypothetical protein EW146_g3535 [Bondarzewia mesenterica]